MDLTYKNHQKTILKVTDLSISYKTRKGDVPAVRGVSFKVHQAETVGIVGESGCGKSTVAFGIVDFLGRNGRVAGGEIKFQGKDLSGHSRKNLRQLRGSQIAMVYQDPMQALNPSLRIGIQLAEALVFHQKLSWEEARDRSIDMLKRVYMPDADVVMDRYPHQLSGGQQQRVVIAMAFLNYPALLIMDEPTTALDVTVEASILDLIGVLKEDFKTGIIYITHNLGVVARVCDSISVMYAGEMMEQGTVDEIFRNPRHPYTQGLMRCVPKLGSTKANSMLYPIRGHVPSLADVPIDVCVYAPRCDYAKDRCMSGNPDLREITNGHQVRCFFSERIDRRAWIPASQIQVNFSSSEVIEKERDYSLNVNNLRTYYQQNSKSVLSLLRKGRKRYVKAVDDVSFEVSNKKTFGIVGESGCGKTTLAKTIIGLEKSNYGKAEFLGFDLTQPIKDRELELIREIQMVFQNPDSTLDPSYSVGRQIGRPLRRFKITPKNRIKDQVIELLRAVRLGKYYYDRLPRQLSGGEKQRVGIARALASRPDMILCDEPVSSLDVSVQASILNLMIEIQEKFGTSIIFITHDLSVVRFISDYIAVMYLGQFVEIGHAETIYVPPYHPYTEALLSAVPIPDRNVQQKRLRLSGTVPSALEPPQGCRFHTRCPRRAMLPDRGKICEMETPPWRMTRKKHRIFCHIPLEELSKIEAVVVGASNRNDIV